MLKRFRYRKASEMNAGKFSVVSHSRPPARSQLSNLINKHYQGGAELEGG